MPTRLSVLVITKNAADTLALSLASAKGLADEIVAVDDYSDDATEEITRKFSVRFFKHRQESFGGQRKYGISKCTGEWVLMLDADEVIGDPLKAEIRSVLEKPQADGYQIPFCNHFLGHELRHGGETYAKLILFRKDKAEIVSEVIHEKAAVRGRTETLRNPMQHYSYRSLSQIYAKFREYAVREAQRKRQNGERSGLVKLFTYPVHMFWSRYIEDGGYRDHVSRIFLDLGFAYMEFLTYLFLLQEKNKKS